MPKNSNHPGQSRPATKNFILNALPKEDFERLLPDLEEVNLSLGEIIYQAEQPIKYLYFPNNAMISVIANTAKGECAEVGIIGWEGIVGIDALMGIDSTYNENLIQLSDGAHRISTAAVRKEFKRGGAFHDLTLSFIRVLMVQISQTALCNRLHTLEERLARWLLMCHDRAPADKLTLTQKFLSIMLGTNRATVTYAAIAMQNAGFIKYKRGSITIADREGLEYFACDCYKTVKAEYKRFQTQPK